MTTKANRIDAYRDERTGEIAPPHRIGTTASGRNLYQAIDGWEPVCLQVGPDGEESYVPSTRVRCDRAGNWYLGD